MSCLTGPSPCPAYAGLGSGPCSLTPLIIVVYLKIWNFSCCSEQFEVFISVTVSYRPWFTVYCFFHFTMTSFFFMFASLQILISSVFIKFKLKD